MSRIIGIDLGTTNTVVASFDGDAPQVVINAEGARLTPSVVAFSAQGERLVGDVAKRQMLLHPERTIHAVKRLMGRTYAEVADEIRKIGYTVVEERGGGVAIDIDGQTVRPEAVSAAILSSVRDAAQDFLGDEIVRAVITVPAYFDDRQRQATRDAAELAGLEVARIINEPTAAALAYVAGRTEPTTIAVFDFGGGTFDVSILQVEEGVAEVLATAGNNRLGGVDIDERIIDWLTRDFWRETGCDLGADKVARQRLREAAERAKLELSTTEETDIHLPFLVADENGPHHLRALLSRARFETMCEDIFEATLSECRDALEAARLRPGDIDEVVMVGGSSRIPRIQEMVTGLFGCSLNRKFHPDEVVAIGAAMQAGMMSGQTQAVTLLDVNAFSLGIEVEGGLMAALIPRNSTVPISRTRMVSTVEDNQRTVEIHVLQGENKRVQQNVSLGRFLLTGIPAMERARPRIQVTFAIDTNGMVEVSARELSTNVKQSISIARPGAIGGAGHSDTSHSSMSQSDEPRRDLAGRVIAADDRDDPERQKAEVEIGNLERLLERHGASLSPRVREDAGLALQRGRAVLRRNPDSAKLKELRRYLRRLYKSLRDRGLGGAAVRTVLED